LQESAHQCEYGDRAEGGGKDQSGDKGVHGGWGAPVLHRACHGSRCMDKLLIYRRLLRTKNTTWFSGGGKPAKFAAILSGFEPKDASPTGATLRPPSDLSHRLGGGRSA
jgi:hypothetical protein